MYVQVVIHNYIVKLEILMVETILVQCDCKFKGKEHSQNTIYFLPLIWLVFMIILYKYKLIGLNFINKLSSPLHPILNLHCILLSTIQYELVQI